MQYNKWKIVGDQLPMKNPIEFKDKLCCRSGVPIAKCLATLISYSPYGILISWIVLLHYFWGLLGQTLFLFGSNGLTDWDSVFSVVVELHKIMEGTHKKMGFLINQYIPQNDRNQVRLNTLALKLESEV